MNRIFFAITILTVGLSVAACDESGGFGDLEGDLDSDTFAQKYNELSYPVCFTACDANQQCNSMFATSFIDMDKCIRNSCDPNDGRWRCEAECATGGNLSNCGNWEVCVQACQKDVH